MKAFNLEEYLKNPSRKLITRDGRKVRILCTEARGYYPIVALVERNNSEVDDAFSYTKDGRFLTIETDERDIFFAPEEVFSPRTLHPFDKVLVRNNKDEYWSAMFFSHMDDYLDIHRAVCGYYSWAQCIPYNDETKHLVGTREYCPEYYKWWQE